MESTLRGDQSSTGPAVTREKEEKMEKYKKYLEETSTNGWRGIDILVPEKDYEDVEECEGLPEGDLRDCGKTAGRRVLVFTPRPGAGTYLSFATEVVEGGTTVCKIDLQSNKSITVSMLGPVAITRSYGYKGRSTTITLWRDGQRVELSESHLLALGLIEPDTAPVDIPAPAPVSSATADQLRKQGLV